MSSGVSFNGNIVYPNTNLIYPATSTIANTANFAQNAAVDYAVGSTVESASGSVFAGLGAAAAIEGAISFAGAAKKAKAEGTTIKELFISFTTALKSEMPKNVKLKDVNGTNAYNLFKKGLASADAKAVEKLIPNAEKMAKVGETAQNHYANATKWLERSKTATTEVAKKKSLLCADRALVKAGQAAKSTSKLSTFLNKIPGVSKASKAISSVATKSPSLAKVAKFAKNSGAGLIVAFEGIGELISNVIPTFSQLGAEKGIKQLGKSTFKVAASAGGWVAGAAAGAAIGSVIPGAGTVVGGIIGGVISTVCGMLGSSVASKVASSITGKSELEKAQEQAGFQAEQTAQVETQTVALAQPQSTAQATTTQSAVQSATQTYSSNPFASAGWMDKDIMALTHGYAV